MGRGLAAVRSTPPISRLDDNRRQAFRLLDFQVVEDQIRLVPLLRRSCAVAPSRPYWKGYLKLSLVSCPIALYTASSSTERVSFRQINKKTGNRLRQQLVDEVTRDPVESQDKGRGYEYSKGAYILVDDDELDAVAIESSHTIEIDSFVPGAQIDERYLDSPYYITPNDQVGQEAFAVIREAMRGKGMVALARVVLAKREHVIMLKPWDDGLLGTTLRYPYEIRDSKEYFDDIPAIKVPPDMRKLAEHILQSKAGDFDPSQFVDHYEEAVVEMLKKKEAGIPISRSKSEDRPRNVVNLMDALKRSIASEKGAPARAVKGKEARRGSNRNAAADLRQEGQTSRQASCPERWAPAKGRIVAPQSHTGVILVQCMTCNHKRAISEQDLTNYGLRPGAPITSFVKRLRCLKCGSASVMAKRSPSRAA